MDIVTLFCDKKHQEDQEGTEEHLLKSDIVKDEYDEYKIQEDQSSFILINNRDIADIEIKEINVKNLTLMIRAYSNALGIIKG
uniref:Uncharacterized protein n=1 Tax=Lutzomyia longipalpis TaxID=7200 RepID=A0A1B0EZ72_LUTLO